MVSLNRSASLYFNGTTPIKIGGQTYYEWDAQKWLDGAFFSSSSASTVLTVNLVGRDWGMGILRGSGEMGMVVKDGGGANRSIDAIAYRGDGVARITLTKTDVDDIDTGSGADIINIGNVLVGTIATWGGNDRLNVTSSQWLGTVDLGAGNDTAVFGADSGLDFLKGGEGNDRITIKGEVVFVDAGQGNDVITTGDKWFGTIEAGRGRDKVIIGSGEGDQILLGRDADIAVGRAHAGVIHIAGGENVSNTSERDSDTLNLLAHSERIYVDMWSGVAEAWSEGSYEFVGFEHVIGGSNDDSINDNYEDNRIGGGGGNDTISAGFGADTLIGNGGADTFDFNFTDSRADRIEDFNRGAGDKISLWSLDADQTQSGKQSFDFIGASAFSVTAGELRAVQSGSVTRIMGDVDGNGTADFTIVLTRDIALMESDFILI